MSELSNENWISIKKVGLPEFELTMKNEVLSIYDTKEVLIQTEHEEMFIAFCQKVQKHNEWKKEIYWYAAHRTLVIDKVVAWMELPDRYEGE